MHDDRKRLTDLSFFASGNVMITCIISLTFLFMVFCIIQYSISLRLANEASVQAEDALAASCMAGLSIDLQKFTDTYITGKADVVVEDAVQSYALFNDTLSINLNSDRNELLQNVRVKQYIVYNICWDRSLSESNEKKLDIYYFDGHGLVNEEHMQYEEVYSPNGIKVTQTSVYADILFDLDIMGGRKMNCHRQLLTQAYKK